MGFRYYWLVLAILVVFVSVFYITGDTGDTITGYATTDSQVGNLSATILTSVSCSWSEESLNVTFGDDLNPGDNDINATKNYNMTNNGTYYNVTVGALSNVMVNISIRGSDMLAGSNIIEIGNITWFKNVTADNGTDMHPGNSIALETAYDTDNYVGAYQNISNTTYFRFWLDIPSSTLAGAYKGNYTMLCEQAT